MTLKKNNSRMNGVVDVRNLSVIHGNEKILNKISFSIDPGEIVLIAGPTGSGKTTLAYCLSGVIPNIIDAKVEGIIRVCGLDPTKRSLNEIAQRVGLVLQNPEDQIVSSIVWKDIEFSLRNIGYPEDKIEKRISELLELVGLKAYKDLYTNYLSDGQKQRLAIASILALEPEVLILDEPTSMLDILNANTIVETLRKIAKENLSTIIIIEHRINRMLNLATRVILLDSGKIIYDGDSKELLRGNFPEVLKKRLRSPVENPIYYISKRKINNANRNIKIEAKNVVVEENNVRILGSINLNIFEGEVLAIVGPNGSGKSTLAQVLAGLTKPTKGRVLIDGVNIGKLGIHERVRKVNYVIQNPDLQIFTTRVWDEVAYTLRNLCFPEKIIRERVEWSLKLLDLWEFRDKNPYTLSRGQRRKLTLASALALQPHVLILDEVTTGLDEESLRSIENIIIHMKNNKRTIILITHDMSIISRCADRVCFLKNGKIVWLGDVREYFNRAILRRLWYGA